MRFILLFIGLVAFPALSNWQLDNHHSSLSFISIKNTDIAEAHHFNQLSGSLTNDGQISFIIDLLSVDTNIAIRNDRMKQFLFNTKLFPTANFNAQLDMKKFHLIAVGQTGLLKLAGEVNLHGRKQKMMFDVLVAKLSEKSFVVSAMKPVLLNAQQFGLSDGVKKLQELAKLPSISAAVPLSFVLTFNE
jgi:polyisoprenoid-binding protein YceI